jgi:hypothetical protein
VEDNPFASRNAPSLRPDPGRVVLRPFRPTIEPREMNPTDRGRANHIVGRVLALESGVAERELDEIVHAFERRHRNLIATFDARADAMEPTFAAHGAFTPTQRRLVGAYFCHE